jgi:hypothetical protein
MKKHRLLLGLAALALVVSACGDGETGDTTATTAAGDVTTTSQGSETTTTAAAETTTTAAGETTTTAASSSGDTGAFQEALEKSGEINSAQMEGTMAMSGIEGAPAGGEVTIDFSGAFDNANEIFAFKMDLSGAVEGMGEEIPPEMAGLLGDMEIINVGDDAYMKFGFFSMFLGSDTEWIKMSADETGEAAGGFTGVNPVNPSDMFAAFTNQNVDIVELGTEDVRGVATTHYRAVVDARAMAEESADGSVEGLEELGELPEELEVDFWIDDDRYIRRFALTIDGSQIESAPGEGFASMVMTYEMFAFNEPVNVTVPAEGEYTDIEDLNFDLGDLDLGA